MVMMIIINTKKDNINDKNSKDVIYGLSRERVPSTAAAAAKVRLSRVFVDLKTPFS